LKSKKTYEVVSGDLAGRYPGAAASLLPQLLKLNFKNLTTLPEVTEVSDSILMALKRY